MHEMNRFNLPVERVRQGINLRAQPVDEIARAAFGISGRGVSESEQHVSFCYPATIVHEDRRASLDRTAESLP
jgi:hypothetical protein